MDKEEAMAILQSAFAGEGLSENELKKMLANSVAQDDSACGFAVEPRTDCPHVVALPAGGAAEACKRADQLLRGGCEVCGSTGENWVCLATSKLLCSRYVAGHMLHHAEQHKESSSSSSGGAAGPLGPCTGSAVVAISLSDFSAWCFGCDSYVADPAIEQTLDVLRAAKFGGSSSC